MILWLQISFMVHDPIQGLSWDSQLETQVATVKFAHRRRTPLPISCSGNKGPSLLQSTDISLLSAKG
jgi:hypothetical protein